MRDADLTCTPSRYPTRNEVESANSSRLARLSGNPKMYHAKDTAGRNERGRTLSPERVERALKDVIAPKDLPLKIGAQVMLVKVRPPLRDTLFGLSSRVRWPHSRTLSRAS